MDIKTSNIRGLSILAARKKLKFQLTGSEKDNSQADNLPYKVKYIIDRLE